MTDAMITWVDGSDPVHKKKRQDRRARLAKVPVKEAIADTRFTNHDEIRYCLRSIHNHAPWIKRIFLVTDNQYPRSIDKEKAEKFGIYQINHSDIFRGHEHCLPTFNSRSIENMMFRIDGLSDAFLYLNDDVFFVSRSKKSHFFEAVDTPKIYAKRKLIPENIENIYVDGLVNAARAINSSASYYLWPSHFAHPLSVSFFRELQETLGQRFFDNAALPFRQPGQFQPVAASYAYLHWLRGKSVRRRSRLFGLEISEGRGDVPLRQHGLRRVLLEHGAFRMCCINDWDNAESKLPGVLDSLKKATGPVAPFEL